MNFAVVDVGIGNIDSVKRALHFLGVEFVAAKSPADLQGVTHVLLPGVGAYSAGMAALENSNMVEPLRAIGAAGTVRVLGICLGMQLLGESSAEGACPGLGLLPFKISALTPRPDLGIKVPHVGFSGVYGYEQTGIFSGLAEHSDFYFTHSFACTDKLPVGNMAYTDHGDTFVSAFQVENISGAQFHPEKSQSNGLHLLRNFALS